MDNRIRVCVFRRGGRKCYEAQWRDPVNGRKQTRSTGEVVKRKAERVAAVIEEELRSGRFQDQNRITWDEFRDRCEAEVVPSFVISTANTVSSTFNALERIISPALLLSLDADQISRFQSKLRKEAKSEATIRCYLRTLRSALNWGVKMEIFAKSPRIAMPKRNDDMKGRPITTEEFERLLERVPDALRTKANLRITDEMIASWQHLLNGLWWSGLRLGEALKLHWTDDSQLCVDFSGRRPMFRIHPRAQKSNKETVLPMAPEFAEFVEQNTPQQNRRGYVFNPIPRRNHGRRRPRVDSTSNVICRFGSLTGVKVAENPDTGKIKYAFAHDLRRAFGMRWSHRVMPAVLQQMMRHESIQTTMQYYVGRNAESAADAIWSAFANTFANSDASLEKSRPAESSQLFEPFDT